MTVEGERKEPAGLTITTHDLVPEPTATKSPTLMQMWPTNSSPRASGPGKGGFDTDIEAMMSPVEGMASVTSSGRACRKSLIAPTVNDCQIWPGKEHWKRQDKEAKVRRSCAWLARLPKTTRLVVKLAMGLFIIGVAVGVGVGISKSLNAPIYGDKDNSPSR